MKRRYVVFVSAILSVMFLMQKASMGRDNLLKEPVNPYEIDITKTNALIIPGKNPEDLCSIPGWAPGGWSDIVYVLMKDDLYRGKHPVMVEIGKYMIWEKGATNSFGDLRCNYRFKPETNYTFSVWVKPEAIKGVIFISINDGSGKEVKSKEIKESGKEWQLLRLALRTSPQAGGKDGVLKIKNEGFTEAGSRFYLSGMRLVEGEESEAEIMAAAPGGEEKKVREKHASIRRIGAWKQLFLDDYIIDKLEGDLKPMINPAWRYSKEPVLKADKPWEFESIGWGPALYDEEEKIFKTWYEAFDGDYYLKNNHKHRVTICYAVSKDGIHWEKPDLGLVEFNGTKNNNILYLSPPEGDALDTVSVVKDKDEQDASKRYKLIIYNGGSLYRNYSADGIHWDGFLKRRIENVITSDAVSFNCDTLHKRYAAYTKVHVDNRRARSITVSEDFEHWTPARLILAVDENDPPDLQLYMLAAQNYADLLIGLLLVFHTDPQTLDIQLAMSRDGLNWERVRDRKTFLPLGEAGAWDSKMLEPKLNGFIVKDDKIWIYYTGTDVTHNIDKYKSDIGLATLRLDGFVSLNAGQTGGTLLTAPFIFKGNQLEVNADARGGSILVELQDEAGNPLPGFEKDKCRAITTDGLRQVVNWGNEKSALQALAGASQALGASQAPVRLKFFLKNAKLYSFGFVN